MRVESEPGPGSRFTVSLPWHAVPAVSVAAEAPPAVRPSAVRPSAGSPAADAPLVLIADDNQVTATVVADCLHAHGYRTRVAYDGETALRMAAEERPAVVLMHIQMPGLDGLETIRRLRGMANLGDLPIAAVTAPAMPGARERCVEAGADVYLSKPVPLAALREMIERLRTYT